MLESTTIAVISSRFPLSRKTTFIRICNKKFADLCVGFDFSQHVDTLPSSDPFRVTYEDYRSRGVLVPDEPVNMHFKRRILPKIVKVPDKIWILSGIPRRRFQAQVCFSEIVKQMKNVKFLHVHLTTPREECLAAVQERLKREKRLDDANPEALKERFERSEEDCNSLVSFLDEQKIPKFEIDGSEMSSPEIHSQVFDFIGVKTPIH